MEKLRIIFMGTPDFAVGILDTIYNSQFEIVAVITAPDKPAGRGQKVAVKKSSVIMPCRSKNCKQAKVLLEEVLNFVQNWFKFK